MTDVSLAEHFRPIVMLRQSFAGAGSLHTITPWAAYEAAGGTRLMHRLSLISTWHPQ